MKIIMMSLIAAQARAESEVKKSAVDFSGEARVIATLPPEFVVNADGDTMGQGFVLDSRLRPNLKLKVFGLDWEFEGDLFRGQFAGDPWDLEGDSHRLHPESIAVIGKDNFLMRKASVTGRFGLVKIQTGLVNPHWGMGLVANDGAHEGLFGRADYGDRVFRTKVSTQLGKGNPFFLSAFGDLVIEDDMARFSEGPKAYQGGGAALFALPVGHRLGALVVYRDQMESDGVRKTEGFILDLHGKGVFELGSKGHKIEIEAEAAHIRGETSRFSNLDNPDGMELSSFGLSGRASISLPEEKATFHLNGGWSSGDGQPDDGTLQDFSFDRDFNLGLIAFDQHQAALDVALYNKLTDRAYSGQSPDGVDALVSEGAVRKVVYVQPAIEYKATSWLGLKAGVLLPWRTAPIAQGFNTFRNGGNPVNHLGQETSGYWMGPEINWGLSLDGSLFGVDKLVTDVQGGHFMRSEDLGGTTLNMIMLRSRYNW